jgi:hypothetical protein
MVRRRVSHEPPFTAAGCIVSSVAPRALVVLRLPHGSSAPVDGDVRAAIRADRLRLALPPSDACDYQLAGPYRIEIAGRALDEYVAWEV